MSVKRAVRQQYQIIVDTTQGTNIRTPAEGWIRTVRKALGMSGAQLAKRMGLTRARIAQAEKAELEGGVTLKSMQAAAEAMGCHFVYAFVPPDTIENVIIAQARKKAQKITGIAGKHMALEDQAVSAARTNQEVVRLMNELIYEMPPDFWEEK
ncbi:mobile mystery protein A [Rhizobium calliandrae]|uniref:Mobile mystery protein A n=1 Tax=Rhizobium calliandrae TaxID=1312182 RepID=A0ABT7KHC0_9HYPH|nr:mobile mystery protein A [Rhizobium calliandrae]MDL2408024.1 mobile mystery protein A [Rhizobium calliandrae]